MPDSSELRPAGTGRSNAMSAASKAEEGRALVSRFLLETVGFCVHSPVLMFVSMEILRAL